MYVCYVLFIVYCLTAHGWWHILSAYAAYCVICLVSWLRASRNAHIIAELNWYTIGCCKYQWRLLPLVHWHLHPTYSKWLDTISIDSSSSSSSIKNNNNNSSINDPSSSSSNGRNGNHNHNYGHDHNAPLISSTSASIIKVIPTASHHNHHHDDHHTKQNGNGGPIASAIIDIPYAQLAS
jgi:hypothetical protein